MDTFLDICVKILVPLLTVLLGSSWFANLVSKRIDNKGLCARIEALEYKIDLNQAETYRTRILRFNGEIKRGVHHDEEEFNDCLAAIDGYERFCKDHPDYPNNKAVMAVENVKSVYRNMFASNGF